MKNVLNEITQVMEDLYGIDVSKYNEFFMQKLIKNRCAESGIKTFYDYPLYLSNNREEAEKLSCSLNITYTEFFRNSLVFAHLEKWILPKLIEEKSDSSELRIWSAGCASGQEPYSIAMLLDKFNATNKKTLRYRIIATDISESKLSVARKGEYNEKAIQNIKVKHLNDYFRKNGETYTICSRLKEYVSFSTYDLLDNLSSCPQDSRQESRQKSLCGNFDLVFCSNLLFYYRPEHQQYILQKLIGSMSENGYIITGETEKYLATNISGLNIVTPPASIFQKKRV